MDSRPKICGKKCEGCLFASCNFNPAFLNLVIAKKRAEASYSSQDRFAWVGVEMAYANADDAPGRKHKPDSDKL